MTDLNSINRIHDSMFLFGSKFATFSKTVSGSLELTAIPANAPAAMFWMREKFGGRDS